MFLFIVWFIYHMITAYPITLLQDLFGWSDLTTNIIHILFAYIILGPVVLFYKMIIEVRAYDALEKLKNDKKL